MTNVNIVTPSSKSQTGNDKARRPQIRNAINEKLPTQTFNAPNSTRPPHDGIQSRSQTSHEAEIIKYPSTRAFPTERRESQIHP
jgi:hypothetical protein